MRYALALLTHGRAREQLDVSVTSFWQHAQEKPDAFWCHADGPGDLPPAIQDGDTTHIWTVTQADRQHGFCRATRWLWGFAAEMALDDYDAVFWLENDFRFTRDFSPQQMFDILRGDPGIAQVSLPRQPVSVEEKRAGSLKAMLAERGHAVYDRIDWVEHDGYFTTNPSLMRASFMRDNPWPSYDRECEGRFGIDLRYCGYRFAILGDGTPYVEHIGHRNGRGY